MGAFFNAMREEGTREEILEALAEVTAQRDLLRKAIGPLVAIANAYDANLLDDGARKYWGATTPATKS